jgi:drug/metabolite transporter (DMT)-like permease
LVLGLAIASALALGVADYLAGATLRRDGRTDSALVYATIGAVFGAVIVLAALPLAPPDEFTSEDLRWSIAAGLSVGLALPLLMIGMARGPMAVVAPVLGLVSLAVPAVVGPILGDQLSGFEALGLLVAFPAAGLVSISDHGSSQAAPIPQAIAIAALAGILFGSSAVFFGQTNTASGIAPGVVSQITAAVLLVVATVVLRKVMRPHRDALWIAVGVGGLTALAVFLSVLAYQRGPVAIVAAVIGLAPGPTVLMAWLLAREKVTRIQLVGFAFGAVAVVLFAAG